MLVDALEATKLDITLANVEASIETIFRETDSFFAFARLPKVHEIFAAEAAYQLISVVDGIATAWVDLANNVLLNAKARSIVKISLLYCIARCLVLVIRHMVHCMSHPQDP